MLLKNIYFRHIDLERFIFDSININLGFGLMKITSSLSVTIKTFSRLFDTAYFCFELFQWIYFVVL